MMRFSAVAALASTLVLAACGSTVQLNGQSLDSGDLQPGQSAVGEAPDGSTPQSLTSANGTAVTSPDYRRGTRTAGPGTERLVAPATAPPRGTKLAPIEVGILLFPDVSQFSGSFGGTADAGNQSLQVDTVINWINRHGGAAGHRVIAVKHNVSLTSSDTYDQMAEQACEYFTVDHHVVAVIAPGTNVNNNFAKCLQKRGVLYLSSGHWVHDLLDWKQFPNMWSSAEADGRGVGQAMVDLVLGRPLAKKGEAVGLMVMEQPAALRTANGIIKPQLKAAGINVVEYTVPPPASTADIANSVAVNNSAELKMASQGIKTVLFLCPGCLPFFAKNADSQRYYPTYVGSSFDTPAGPFGMTGPSYDASMRSAVMVGWEPDNDVGLYTHPKELTGNPTRDLCRQIMKPSGQSTGNFSEYSTQVICDGFLQVTYAAELNPANPLTGPALQRGMGLFGTKHPCALSFSTSLSPDHHGGATSYRLMHWDLKTHAFAYDSPRRLLAFRLPD